MENITNGIMDFKSLERIIFNEMCQIAIQLIQLYLRTWDAIIKARRNTTEYRFHSNKETHIKTMFGEVSYTRAYYHRKGGGYVFLLDEAMGIKAGCGQVGENLAEMLVVECADKSFRKAAQSISDHTGQSINRMGAWKVTQRFAEELEARQARLEELAEREVTGLLGNVSSKVLIKEYDDVALNRQRPQRRKRGAPKEAGRERIGYKLMHIATAYTGLGRKKDGSYEALNKVAYASYGDPGAFSQRFEALLQHFYDMDGVQRVLANGDGEGWIKTAVAETDAILQLDPYHRNRAITLAVKRKEDRNAIHEAFSEKDARKVLDIIRDLIRNESEKDELAKLEKLLKYFDNNKDNLLSIKERGVSLPDPPDGVVYGNMGLQEHSNCDILTQRMKHRKGSWSEDGANNMAKILCLINTVGLEAMKITLPEVQASLAPKEVFSAAKAPVYDGNGYEGSWLRAALPLEEAFVTNGRKAIRNLIRQRSISDLRLV